MKEICANCIWFRPEPGTPIDPNASVVVEQETDQSLAQKAAHSGGSRPPVYGKCYATYQNKKVTIFYDFGTFSNNDCSAVDDKRLKLFKAG